MIFVNYSWITKILFTKIWLVCVDEQVSVLGTNNSQNLEDSIITIIFMKFSDYGKLELYGMSKSVSIYSLQNTTDIYIYIYYTIMALLFTGRYFHEFHERSNIS